MAYNLYSGQGWVGQVASLGGYGDLLDFVNNISVGSELKKLMDSGTTNNPQRAAMDVAMVLNMNPPPDVKTTLENLRALLEQAKGQATIGE